MVRVRDTVKSQPGQCPGSKVRVKASTQLVQPRFCFTHDIVYGHAKMSVKVFKGCRCMIKHDP